MKARQEVTKATAGQYHGASKKRLWHQKTQTRSKRPVVDVIDCDISTPPPRWEFLSEHRTVIKEPCPPLVASTCPKLLTTPYAGTGFSLAWRNGRLCGLKIRSPKWVCGFDSRPQHQSFNRSDLSVIPTTSAEKLTQIAMYKSVIRTSN